VEVGETYNDKVDVDVEVVEMVVVVVGTSLVVADTNNGH
jgi:hypothetical protein